MRMFSTLFVLGSLGKAASNVAVDPIGETFLDAAGNLASFDDALNPEAPFHVDRENEFPKVPPHEEVFANREDEEEFMLPLFDEDEKDRRSSGSRLLSMFNLADEKRQLSATSAAIGTFHQLECNQNLNSATCTDLTSVGSSLTIPCGQCMTWRVPGDDVTISGGINVIGKLKFPNNWKVTIRTKSVIVQGELKIKADKDIAPINEAVVFNITGTSDVMFTNTMTENPNKNVCPNGSCNLGPKPFFVAGGKLNIDAFPDNTCKTHTPILKVLRTVPVKDSSDFPKYEEFPNTCPQSGTTLLRYTFDDGNVGNWTGGWGAYVEVSDGALKVTNRQRNETGPMLDITKLKPQLCLKPDRDYLFSVRLKIDSPEGKVGEYTRCSKSSRLCPRLNIHAGRPKMGERYTQLIRISSNAPPKYGEWYQFTAKINFREDHLWTNTTYTVLELVDTEAGADLSMKDFKISLPSEETYLNPSDVCSELIGNGDAESNGYNPYPFYPISWGGYIQVRSDANNSNKYFHYTDRKRRWDGIETRLDPRCMDKGVEYEVSARIRLHTLSQQRGYMYVRVEPNEGNAYHRSIVQCPFQTYSDGFVLCTGIFTVDHKLADSSSKKVKFRFEINDSNELFSIDYDDISIKRKRGFINGLVVSNDDTVCWGEGADVQVGTSVFFSESQSVLPNSFTSDILNIQTNGGDRVLELKDIPTLPITTQQDSIMLAAQVALVSRNVKIGGDVDELENRKGAYLQVLHTTNQDQLISGVEFEHMGRRGEEDKFPIQIQYSGSLPGTLISKNSIHDSQQRCIVIDGTANITLSDNVAANNYGHCIFVGHNASDNTISGNYVSHSRSIDYREDIPGESDNQASGLVNVNGPNDYVSNIAVGNQGDGFRFSNDWRLRIENNTYVSGNMRRIPMGRFSGNVAGGNLAYGMRFENHEQDEAISIDNVISFYNRIYGFYMYNARFATLRDSKLVGNGYGVEMKWSDDVSVSDTVIRGLSQEMEELSRRPYFSSPCKSHWWPYPLGYRMQSQIYRSDFSNDGKNNRGMSMSNVDFYDFDHSDEWQYFNLEEKYHCSHSASIGINTSDKRDNHHFNYVSSFKDVSFDGPNTIDLQTANANEDGVHDVVVVDPDGGSDPAQQSSSASVFVSDKEHLIAFASDCTSYSALGMAYCPNTCYRGVTVFANQIETSEFDLKVTRASDSKFGEERVTYAASYYPYDGPEDIKKYRSEDNERKFHIALPQGSYKFEFVDVDEVVWPGSAYEIWEGIPDCDGYANGTDVTLVEPPLSENECNELIKNSYMSQGAHFWGHRNGGVVELANGGVDNSPALKNVNRTRFYDGIGQTLDVRCFRDNVNEFYEISVMFKSINETTGLQHVCDPYSGNNLVECPILTLKNGFHPDLETKDKWDWNHDHYGKTVQPIDPTGFNMIHGVFQVNERISQTRRAWIYIEYVHKTLDIIVDDFSVSKLEAACTGNFIRNAKFNSGNTKFWKNYGTVKYNIVSIGDNNVIEFKEKDRTDHGLMQYLYADRNCFKKGDRFLVQAKFRIIRSGNHVRCTTGTDSSDISRCGWMYLRTDSSEVGYSGEYISTGISISEDLYDGWDRYAGIYTVSEKAEGHSSMYLRFLDTHVDAVVQIDDVKMTPLSRYCTNMLQNGSFESGYSSYWRQYSGASTFTIVPGGANEGDYALRFVTSDSSTFFEQKLDSRCFEEGQVFEITAQFKLLNATDQTTMTCDTAERNYYDNDHCPLIYMRGEGCTIGDQTGQRIAEYLWNESQEPWDKDTFNLFTFDFSVNAALSTCERLRVGLGRFTPNDQVLLIDEVSFGHKTTLSPTATPTFNPTKAIPAPPTAAPVAITESPTTSVSAICPPVGTSVQLQHESVKIRIASVDSVCSVTKVTIVGREVIKTIPIARSYAGGKWERAAGEIASRFIPSDMLCYNNDSYCQIDLPPLSSGEEYRLSSFTHSLDTKGEMARFLETSTFGVTSSELTDLTNSANSNGNLNAIASWFSQQVDKSATSLTSHRKYWRERVGERIPSASQIGSPNHPCDANSKWRKFSFVRNDMMWRAPKDLQVKGNGPFDLYLDNVFRTRVADFWKDRQDYTFDPDFVYDICRETDERVDGRFWFRLENGTCVEAENPQVNLDGAENLANYIINLNAGDLAITDTYISNEEILIHSNAINSNICNSIPDVPEEFGGKPVFGKVNDGPWLIFDSRIVLDKNSPNSPIPDGGKTKKIASGGRALCSNVARNFLNEDSCQLSSNACRPTSADSAKRVTLDNTTISELNYLVTGRYVYQIKGVNVIDQTEKNSDFPTSLPHPCTPGMRSRWEKIDVCNATEILIGTNDTLHYLLQNSGDDNPYITDIYFPEAGRTCNSTDTNPVIEIEVYNQEDGSLTCYKRVHDDYMSVYDMTYWLDKHPGMAGPIMKWAENNGTTLIFPNESPTEPHNMLRWEQNKLKFSYVGRFGDDIRIRDFPNEFRTENVTSYYDPPDDNDNGILVCGSHGEIDNNQGLEFVYGLRDDYSTGFYSSGEDKMNVWYQLSLSADDQLRQKIAWSLSQILVVVTEAVSDGFNYAEWFLYYYDIFVRNAFGNYRDILKEISFSPIMAENLSFLRSKSSAYLWEKDNVKTQADENFAREIMQLFSMGINKLNLDGTPFYNENGNMVLAYTNDDIESFARAWTGFDLQPRRSNIEGRDNRLDPMKIEPLWRDRFPKSDSTGGYIGDRYVKCEDIPAKAFLKKNAKFRFLGSSPLPQLVTDPNGFSTMSNIERIVLDNNSPLRQKLCDADSQGNCRYENTVILDNSISNCNSSPECGVDHIRVVQVADGAFYEYVQQPCVQTSFYKDPKKISPRDSRDRIGVLCANPKLPEAAEACCQQFKINGLRYSKYDGERVLFDEANERCTNEQRELCDFYRVDGDRTKNSLYFWTSDSCSLHVKIRKDGYLTIVHRTVDSANTVRHLQENNENYFRVQWTTRQNSWPKASNNCGNVCDVVDGDKCLCNVRVIEGQALKSAPQSTSDLDSLHVGALDPTIYDAGSYTKSSSQGITTYAKKGVIDTDTVFEYTDDKGRHYFLNNVIETVMVRGTSNENTGSAFRNPPQFMSFTPSEINLRDAEFETDAVLDHYFYHDNTAPFLALRFIQRLVSSNPSPRYVESVASSFRSGSFTVGSHTFGSGKYGDLEAFFAAIYLDREARTVVLDADPSQGQLREPILKVLAVMRSMSYTSDSPVLRMSGMVNKIGQTSHSFGSVFSFFLPEFKPSGVVGDATLSSPEATLLDMPKMVGLLNGLHSLVNYGLTRDYGGFGTRGYRSNNLPAPEGTLEYGISPSTPFTAESFEGPSLVGGLDNKWLGRDNWKFWGEVIQDPTDNSNSNHVFRPAFDWNARFYSPAIPRSSGNVVKLRYYAASPSRGFAGYTDADNDMRLISRVTSLENLGWSSTDRNRWIYCQFEIPSTVGSFRILLGERSNDPSYDIYFDDIVLTIGSGTSCGISAHSKPNTVGQLNYSESVVEELSYLLTGGRLNAEHKQIIVDAYNKAGSADDGLRMAQKLIFTTSEFHSTSLVKPLDTPRPDVTFPEATGKPYRAVVFMMFSGGCDSFNMLTPYTCTRGKDLYQEYVDVRQQVALGKQDLFNIPAAENQICEEFGIHSALPSVRNLYMDEDLIFFANTGVMSRPVNKQNYRTLEQTQLFAHNHQQRESKRVDPYDTNSGTGILGRISDTLIELGHNVGSFSVDRYSVALVGAPGKSSSPMIVNRNGVPDLYLGDVEEYLPKLHNQTKPESPYFGEMWSDNLMTSLGNNKVLRNELEGIILDTQFGTSYLARQFETVAKLIKTRSSRGADTDTFYVETGGFDTHSMIETNLNNRFIGVNEGIRDFTAALKELGVWENTVVVQTSDFARTLNPNGGDGTDHAWGGNYMVFGGSVKGKKILGEYPDNLTDDGPLTLGRGRMIPSTPWDAVFSGVASWAGVPNNKLDYVLPNRKNFPEFSFDVDDMFGNVPPPGPTTQPSPAPVTPDPTSAPTKERVPTSTPSKAPVPAPSSRPSAKPSASPSKAPIVGTFSPTKSVAPSSAPVAIEFDDICFDDPNYLFQGNDSKPCSWAKRNLEARCSKADTSNNGRFVFEFCRKTCNRCPCKNNDWMFKGDASKNCDWVVSKPFNDVSNAETTCIEGLTLGDATKINEGCKRCGKEGASEHCKSSCGLECKEDDDTWLSTRTKGSCGWFGKLEERCKLDPNAKTKCPRACKTGDGENDENDENDKLWISSIVGDGTIKGCAWAANNKVNRCPKDQKFFYFCPISCPKQYRAKVEG